jgi:hypothetical protein
MWMGDDMGGLSLYTAANSFVALSPVQWLKLLERWKSGISCFEASMGKKYTRSHLDHLHAVMHACHPSYEGNTNRKISIQAGPGIKQDPVSK